MTVISSEEGVLSVFEGRKCDVIKAELLKITSIDSIKQVSMDLFSPYAKAMREIIPTAVITVDRFHVIKLINRVIWNLNKHNFKNLDEIMRKKYSSIRFLLTKDYQVLSKSEKRLVKTYLKFNNKLKTVYELIQDFRNILFRCKGYARDIIKQKLYEWVLKTKGLMRTFVRTLSIWLDGIVNACIFSNSNARQEGINNKIKLLKRRGFGYRNYSNFKYRIMGECNP